GAPRLCTAVLGRGQENKEKDSACHALIGEVRAARDQIQQARESHEAALKLREKLPWDAAESRVALALLALEENQPARAEALARAAAAEFARDKSPHKEGQALA